MSREFFRAGAYVLPVAGIRGIDLTRIVDHEATVVHERGTFKLTGADAIEVVMLVKPSALEGRRLRWSRDAWAVHNMIGHPLLQVLAWLGQPKLGIRVHDATTPRPQR